jgi:alkylation response protein AidB-like acyl-CoA dehydrogenase
MTKQQQAGVLLGGYQLMRQRLRRMAMREDANLLVTHLRLQNADLKRSLLGGTGAVFFQLVNRICA